MKDKKNIDINKTDEKTTSSSEKKKVSYSKKKIKKKIFQLV